MLNVLLNLNKYLIILGVTNRVTKSFSLYRYSVLTEVKELYKVQMFYN